MGVYIKDFEMPKNCAGCQFSDVFAYPPDYDDEWICELTYLSMNWEDAQMRHSNCPLVELPTPHGRLIDADELEEKCHRQALDEWNKSTGTSWGYAYATFHGDVEDAPTIIEAEGKE